MQKQETEASGREAAVSLQKDQRGGGGGGGCWLGPSDRSKEALAICHSLPGWSFREFKLFRNHK